MVKKFLQVWRKYGHYTRWTNGMILRLTNWSRNHPFQGTGLRQELSVQILLGILMVALCIEGVLRGFVGHISQIYRFSEEIKGSSKDLWGAQYVAGQGLGTSDRISKRVAND